MKAFNTTFAGTLVGGEVDGQQLDVLIAGDDETAKQKVSQLADEVLRAIESMAEGELSVEREMVHFGDSSGEDGAGG